MTTIVYQVANHTGKDLLSPDWAAAQALQSKTQSEEISQFGWWVITARITNNDGTTTICPVDLNGSPVVVDSNGNKIPYVDTTISPAP